jgi:PAS domain S-box-containing protein
MRSSIQSVEKENKTRSICAWPARCAACEDREKCPIQMLVEENEILKEEIRVSRESAEITASLVVKQFEETERILRRFQVANAQRKAVLDSASRMAVIATDQTGTIIVFNKGAENLLGYSAAEVIGQLTPLVFHDVKELKTRVTQLDKAFGRPKEGMDLFFHHAAKNANEQEEWTYVRKDGYPFPVDLSINPLRNAEGAISGFLCIAVDITEKKRSEQALKESERNYRLLIDNIPNIVFKGYPDGSVDFFDDKIEAVTGYPKEAFLNRKLRWTDLIIDDDLVDGRDQFVVTLRGDQQSLREYRIRRKDGKVVWLQASSQVVKDADGNIDFISGAFLDISKRKRAEEALLESEEKYRSLFDSGPNPIFVLDQPSLKIIDVNPAAIETYGYAKEELVGRSFNELGEFELQVQELVLDAAFGWPQTCLVNQKVRHYKKDGTPIYLRVKACPIRFNDRQGIILAATDITEAMEKDAQLFQATKMQTLGEMSAGMAHELTQPLNAIKIGNDFLRRMIAVGKPMTNEDIDRVAMSVAGQVQRASGIIHRLREFGRKPDFIIEPVDLNAVINHVVQIIGQQLELNNIRVDFDLDGALPMILVNANRLEQVMFNLISNARDAIEALPKNNETNVGRMIKLSTCVSGDEVVCMVEDTGTGISNRVKDKIFEPFYTTKEVGKGMGLGLAITYGILRDFGAGIEASNREEGGACFTLRFPKVAKHSP